jgi:hypothetical protein
VLGKEGYTSTIQASRLEVVVRAVRRHRKFAPEWLPFGFFSFFFSEIVVI